MVSTGEGTSSLEDNNSVRDDVGLRNLRHTPTRSASSNLSHSSTHTTMFEGSGIEYALLCYLQHAFELSVRIS